MLQFQERQRLRPPGRRSGGRGAACGFFAIAQAGWGLNAEDARALLGAPAERTFYAWRAGSAVRVPMDTLRRIGYVAGIYKALEILYSDPHLADDWIKRAPTMPSGARRPCSVCVRRRRHSDLAAAWSYPLDAGPGAMELIRALLPCGLVPGLARHRRPLLRRSPSSSG